MPDTTRDASSPQTTLAGARSLRAWYSLEQRHQALFTLRVALCVAVAILVVAAPFDLSTSERQRGVLVCAAAIAAHGALRLLADRFPRTLRATVDVGLVVDAGMVLGLAALSGYLQSHALWLIPILCVAVALGLSTLTGVKAVALLAVATGLVALLGPSGDRLIDGLPPLLVGVACVAVAAAMSSVNERELRGRGERLDALHDAAVSFVTAESPEALAEIARAAGARLLPGWEVAVTLDAPVSERRAWRADDQVHLAVPIVSPGHDGRDDDEQAHGMLTGRRPAPRRGRGATLRGQQLRALDTLCAGLAAALTQLHLMRRLEQLSLVDPLTGLGNRRAFDRALDVELARSRRSGQHLGVVMLDVDHFKRFNDTHGHQAGDRALAAVGTCLADGGRREDWSCRIGGEEFALLLPGADEAAAADVAERVRNAVATIVLPEGGVTVSLGVAATTGDEDAAALVARADERLYAAKHQGRNRVVAGDGIASGAA